MTPPQAAELAYTEHTNTDDLPAVLHGPSPVIADVLSRVHAAARSDSPILIAGEPGSGRETVARIIHGWSARRLGPFVKVDCVESPVRRPLDHVVQALSEASDGTVLLSGIEEMPDRAQQALADGLRDGSLHETQSGPLDLTARIVAVVEMPVTEAAASGKLRRELLRRIAHLRIDMPPLRHRREDVPAIAAALLREHGAARAAAQIGPDAALLLSALPWAGNLAELNALARRLALSLDGRDLTLDSLLGHMQLTHVRADGVNGGTLREARETWEREFLLGMLTRHHWQIPATARALGIQRPNLYRKLRTLGIHIPNGERRHRDDAKTTS